MWWTAALLLSALAVSLASEGNIRLLADEIQPALVSCGSKTQNETTVIKPHTEQHSLHSKWLLSERKIVGGVTRNSGRKNFNNERIVESRSYGKNTEERAPGSTINGWFKLEDADSKTEFPKFSQNHSKVLRGKRHEALRKNYNEDECFSQCVFAFLGVVDERGIPRQELLVSRVQNAVSSHQSRTAVCDQLRRCFDELINESEDDGCSYSNKLDECMTLRLRDRSYNVSSSTMTSV